jgi:cyclase
VTRSSTSRTLRMCGCAVGLAVLASLQPDARQGGPGERAIDLMLQSRSQEQPQPSARHIPLPPGNPLEVLYVHGNVYMIAGGPSNVAVQIGSEGVLLVDTLTEELSEPLLQAVRVLSDGPISYIVNTTPNPDHYGGNALIGAAGQNPTIAERDLTGRVSGRAAGERRDDTPGGGPGAALRPSGAIVFAHERLYLRMSAPTGATPAEPFALWPTSTFFTRQKTISFNDEPIEMLHQPAAHTDADLMVFFRTSDVLAVGDVINTLQYPVFDTNRGGSIRGLLDGLNEIIRITVPRFNQMAGTRVIPGHGRILNEADVVEYRDMMTIIYERVRDAANDGKSLAEIQAMQPTLEYDPLYSAPGWTGDMLIEAIHGEVTREVRPGAPERRS